MHTISKRSFKHYGAQRPDVVFEAVTPLCNFSLIGRAVELRAAGGGENLKSDIKACSGRSDLNKSGKGLCCREQPPLRASGKVPTFSVALSS